jgi:hypothetical protein
MLRMVINTMQDAIQCGIEYIYECFDFLLYRDFLVEYNFNTVIADSNFNKMEEQRLIQQETMKIHGQVSIS